MDVRGCACVMRCATLPMRGAVRFAVVVWFEPRMASSRVAALHWIALHRNALLAIRPGLDASDCIHVFCVCVYIRM